VKSAVLHQANKPLTIETLDVRDPAHGEVLVRTATSGVCHSDLHFIDGKSPIKPPAVLGNEASGETCSCLDSRRPGASRPQGEDESSSTYNLRIGSCGIRSATIVREGHHEDGSSGNARVDCLATRNGERGLPSTMEYGGCAPCHPLAIMANQPVMGC
jgi:Alcohol dehydrogenase GroES-like domain